MTPTDTQTVQAAAVDILRQIAATPRNADLTRTSWSEIVEHMARLAREGVRRIEGNPA